DLLPPRRAGSLRQAIPRVHRPPRTSLPGESPDRHPGGARPPTPPPRELLDGSIEPPEARSVAPRDRWVRDPETGWKEDLCRPEAGVPEGVGWLAGWAWSRHRSGRENRRVRRTPSTVRGQASYHSHMGTASLTRTRCRDTMMAIRGEVRGR